MIRAICHKEIWDRQAQASVLVLEVRCDCRRIFTVRTQATEFVCPGCGQRQVNTIPPPPPEEKEG